MMNWKWGAALFAATLLAAGSVHAGEIPKVSATEGEPAETLISATSASVDRPKVQFPSEGADNEAVTVPSESLAAQSDEASKQVDPYIKIVPDNHTFTIGVMGDSLGVGLWQGLYQNFRKDDDPVVDVVQYAQVNTGIVRSDRLNWPDKVEELARTGDFQIAVMLFGGNDMQTIRERGDRHHYQTDGWIERYEARIDRMIEALKGRDIAVYWVGLPIVERKRLREDYIYINEIFRRKAAEHDIYFVDVWDVSTTEDGAYSAVGKTLEGERGKLRARDGVHFTPSGYRKLARYAERLIRDDIREVAPPRKTVLVPVEKPPATRPEEG